jgi:hypothetical protein
MNLLELVKVKDVIQVCEFTNFCVDDANGPFIIHPNQVPPKINMLNADIEMWFQPKRISHAVNAIHVNETLFVHGLYFLDYACIDTME